MSTRSKISAVSNFVAEEEGATAVEYAVMLALICAVVMGSVNFMASNTIQSFEDSSDAIAGAFGN